jgi:hypothetical protein
MFGRFFAFEMGCPNEDAIPGSKSAETVAYLNEDGSLSLMPGQSTDQQDMQDQNPDQTYGQDLERGPDGIPLICECRGLGCKKCKRKKAQIITLTGNPGVPIPIMNMPMGPMSPMGLGGPSMIMMNRRAF